MPYPPLGMMPQMPMSAPAQSDQPDPAQIAQMQQQALADAIRRRRMQMQQAPAASPIPVDQTALSRMPLNPQGMVPLDQRPRYSSYPPVMIGGQR
jgi:hypothetical protein